MDEFRPAAAPVTAKRLRAHRRAKQGLIASYIHGLSERHGRDATAVRVAAAERTAATE